MKTSQWQPRIYAIPLAAIALALIAGGGQLALLGGSFYYLFAGLSLAGVAVLLWMRRREGVWLYAAIIAVTIVWSLWEVGFDGWALMPRLAAWFVVGAWMVTPVFRHSLRPAPLRRIMGVPVGSWRAWAISLGLAIMLGALVQPLRPAVADPRFQAGVGALPERRMAVTLKLGEDWQGWGNDQGGSRFSSLDQITPANVAGLQLAWSAPLFANKAAQTAGLEVTPLMVGGTLYACNNANEIFALDAETGQRRWVHPAEGFAGRTCRGVAYYKATDHQGACAERILTATGKARLVALDAATGKPCADFGSNGTVNLLAGMSKAPEGYYHVTSAPAVVNGMVVIGGWVTDNQYVGEPSGVVRAFDAVTGKLRWAWDMGRPDRTGEPGPGDSYTPGTPNSWGPISADEKLGLVYLPTGNATPDYYGAQRRPFDERYSSSVVALDVATGRVRWSFQTTHHDIWDYDVASQPTLIDLPSGNATIPALVQLTKRGEIFVLNRATGRPIRPVTEMPAPQAGKVPEEWLSPTQPFSNSMPSFRNPVIRESDMWGMTPLDQMLCRIRFRKARYDGPLTPPGRTESISSPGYIGGMNWGSGSVDPERGVMVLNSINLANYGQLIPRDEANRRGLRPVGPGAKGGDVAGDVPQSGTPYGMRRGVFLSPLGSPCHAPPYGFLSAVDLVTGKLVWSRPIGDQLGATMGTPNIGGSITTRSGLVFIGATIDNTFRALDLRNGQEVWRASLPQGGFAVPVTYRSAKSGRQFVVIAAGGSQGIGAANDAKLMAYALPVRR